MYILFSNFTNIKCKRYKKQITMNSPITYHGGSNKVVPNILPLIPEHVTYCEPFAGGASVFFAKKTAKRNYLNDSNSNIACLFYAMANKFDDLNYLIQNTVYDEYTFKTARRLLDTKPIEYDSIGAKIKDDIQRAWAVWVVSKMSLTGSIDCNTFAWDGMQLSGAGSKKLVRTLEVQKSRFEKLRAKAACIEPINQMPIKVIEKVDDPNAFFFVDPPMDYSSKDYRNLIRCLSDIKGKFLLLTSKKILRSNYIPISWNEAQIKGDPNKDLILFNYKKPFEQTKLF